MRISDWSSDVCSSDLHFRLAPGQRLADLGDAPHPGGRERNQPRPPVGRVGAPLDQPLAAQDVEQAHQARSVDAGQRRQLLLGDPASGLVQMDQRYPGRIRQAGGGEMRVERLPPAAGEQREAESEAGAWGDVVGHAPIIRRYDLICNSQYMAATDTAVNRRRSEEHTSELTSLMRSSYAVFYLEKK